MKAEEEERGRKKLKLLNNVQVQLFQSDNANKQTLHSSSSNTKTTASDSCIDFDMLFTNWEASDFPPCKLDYRKFKQELIAIMALSNQRIMIDYSANINVAHSSYLDVNLEDEARRLTDEMLITIQEVQESTFYNKLIEQLQNDSVFQSNIRRVLGSNSHVQMVIYAIGSIEFSYVSQYQFAIAILLKRKFSDWIGEIEVFDPYMSPADCKVMEAFGCNVIPVNEKCRRQAKKPTLFFLPYLDTRLVGNLLGANWCPSQLNQMIILGNSLKGSTDHIKTIPRIVILDGKACYNPKRESLDYIEAIQKHTTEIHISEFGYGSIFGGFSWHFFNLDSDLDLENLLPGDPPKDVRMKLRRYNDKLNRRQFDYRHLNNLEEKYFMEPFFNTDPSVWDWSEMDRVYRNARRMHCLWCPPHAGWIKLNFSGKVFGDNAHAGYGGIFRNDHEDRLAVYSGNLGEEADSAIANAEALRQGLRCLQYMSPIRKLAVEGDNLSVIRWVTGGPEPPKRVAEALSEISKLLEGIEHVVRHVYAEANSLAVELANTGTRLPNFRVWISPESQHDGFPVVPWPSELKNKIEF